MPSIIKYCISIGLLFFYAACVSQTKEAPKKPTKPKKNFAPSGIRIGTDLVDLGKSFGSKTFQGWEVNGDVDFANYYFTADVGSWSKSILLPSPSTLSSASAYSNGGNYYRMGVDINLLGKDPDKNMFFFGFRYGRAMFHESVIYQDTVTSKLFGAADRSITSSNVSGGWAELTSGLRVKIWKGLWMGYTARMKFAPTTSGGNPSLATYDMPGYGIASQKLWWGFNYQLFWRFAWRKDQPVVKK